MRYSLLLLSALFAWTAQGQTTFNVDMTCAPEGFTDVFVTGPWCGWCANDTYNNMTDPDGDGVYSVTVADLVGTVEYKYAINGFDDQENLINDMVNGASCAPVTDYSGYANRQIAADGTANDFYGTCDGTCNDVPVAPAVDVTFQVDMSQYQGTYGTVNINGSFNGWCGACATMTDDDGEVCTASRSDCHRRPTNTNSLWTVGRPKKNSQKAMCARAPSTVTPTAPST